MWATEISLWGAHMATRVFVGILAPETTELPNDYILYIYIIVEISLWGAHMATRVFVGILAPETTGLPNNYILYNCITLQFLFQ